ncbi:unnamed protein product [Cylicostephanus goldi]|uniref:Guanylate kinase-like domain-containing protein n=1 Tax=Cylicostephanus goldi TaxID=71465 RepID=A0A3P7R5N6_CYLGO|nr:unnamed protein product [Cylicostephanus goldi]
MTKEKHCFTHTNEQMITIILELKYSFVHCIVDVSPNGIQRLHSLRIYPIVIRVKFKSAKQIKDVKEDFCGEKITTKQAKDLMDKVCNGN